MNTPSIAQAVNYALRILENRRTKAETLETQVNVLDTDLFKNEYMKVLEYKDLWDRQRITEDQLKAMFKAIEKSTAIIECFGLSSSRLGVEQFDRLRSGQLVKHLDSLPGTPCGYGVLDTEGSTISVVALWDGIPGFVLTKIGYQQLAFPPTTTDEIVGNDVRLARFNGVWDDAVNAFNEDGQKHAPRKRLMYTYLFDGKVEAFYGYLPKKV